MNRKFQWDKRYIYAGLTALAVIAISILFFYLLSNWRDILALARRILSVLSPIIVGLMLAYLLCKPMDYMENHLFKPLGKKMFPKRPKTARNASRGFSVFAVVFLFIALIAGMIALMLPQLISSVQKLIRSADSYYTHIVVWITEFLEDNPELEAYFIQIAGQLNTSLTNFLESVILPRLEAILGGLFGGVTSVIGFFVDFIVGIIVSIYVLFSKERFAALTKKSVYAIFSNAWSNRICAATHFLDRVCGGYIIGQIINSIIIGIISYIALAILKMPYAPLISVVIGVTNVIPFFGPFIGAIPSGFIILLEDPIKCLIFAIFIFVLQQLDGNVLTPKILGNSIGISSFWIIFAILLFGGLFGFWGMLLGVPVFAVLYEGLSYLLTRLLVRKNLPGTTEEFLEIDRIDEQTGEIIKKETNAADETAETEK